MASRFFTQACMKHATFVFKSQTSQTGLKNSRMISSSLSLYQQNKLSTQEGLVQVPTKDKNLDFHPVWLRENCRCNECYTHSTQQRHVLAHHVTASIQSYSQSQDELVIRWEDGHQSTYDPQWLLNNSYPSHTDNGKSLWNKSSLESEGIAKVDYKKFMNSQEGLKDLLESIWRLGIGVVAGAEPTEKGTKQVAERVAFIKETLFGRQWTFTNNLARGDTAYTDIALGAHTDTPYLTEPAGIQVFHCLHHDGTGGETLLVDGFYVAERLRQDNPHAFHLLSQTELYHEYREPGIHTDSLDSIITLHPITKQLIKIRYNHYDRAPITTVPQHQLTDLYTALDELSHKVEDPDHEYWLKLAPGEVLFVDNWRVMHGRAAFTGSRSITGCYLPRDDWLSEARRLGVVTGGGGTL